MIIEFNKDLVKKMDAHKQLQSKGARAAQRCIFSLQDLSSYKDRLGYSVNWFLHVSQKAEVQDIKEA